MNIVSNSIQHEAQFKCVDGSWSENVHGEKQICMLRLLDFQESRAFNSCLNDDKIG